MTKYENIILGCIITDPKLYYQNSNKFNDLMFDEPNNLIVYRAYKNIVKKGHEPDLIKLSKKLGEKGNLNNYLASLCQTPFLMKNEFASMLEELSAVAKRKMIFKHLEDVNNMLSKNDDVNYVIENINKFNNIINFNDDDKQKEFLGQLKEFREEIAKRMQADGITGITTGYKSLNDFTNGWQPTDLVIVGGASSMGKTSFAVSLAYNAVAADVPTAIFSYEMSSIQIIQRIVSIESGIAQKWMNQGALDPKEVKAMDNCIGRIEKSPLIIDDCNNTSLTYLTSKIKQYVHSQGVKLVMVDYLQLVSASTGKSGNREQEVAKVARGLKNLARELNICIIALSQLSRGVGVRSNSRPTLSDLRESGEIEQAADVVVLLYRPEYYGLYENESGESTQGLAEIIFAKGRNIGVGQVNLKFIPELTKFEDYE